MSPTRFDFSGKVALVTGVGRAGQIGNAVALAFGQAGASDARQFLFSLGKVVRRDQGFYTPHGDDAVVSQVADGLFASRVQGAVAPTLRVFHQVAPSKRDAGNALRSGARVFLAEVLLAHKP